MKDSASDARSLFAPILRYPILHDPPHRRDAPRERAPPRPAAHETPAENRRHAPLPRRPRRPDFPRWQVGRLHRQHRRHHRRQKRYRRLDHKLGWHAAPPHDHQPRIRVRAALEPRRPLSLLPLLAPRQSPRQSGLAARPQRRRSAATHRRERSPNFLRVVARLQEAPARHGRPRSQRSRR